MSPQIKVSTKASENLRGGGTFVWPPIHYRGTIEAVETRPTGMTRDGTPFAGFVAGGEELNITLGTITPLEEVPEGVTIGARKFFLSIPLSDGDFTIYDDAQTLREAGSWQLASKQLMAANLATALQATVVENGSTLVDPDFLGNLQDGAYTGMQIEFTIYNRPDKKRKNEDGTAVVYAEIETFKRAA